MELRGNNLKCPSDEIAAYIDGELDQKRELELDVHFVECAIYADELNQQKQFLCELDLSLKRASDLDLPADFAKTIVANAESTVGGLRRPREQYNALFICAGLALFVLFALGTDAARFLGGVSILFEQAVAVGSFFGQVVYSVFIGVSIVVRSLASQVLFDMAIAVALAATCAALMLISKKFLGLLRA